MSEIYKKFTTQKYEVIYEVEEDQDGMRLDQFLAIYLASFSRQQIKKKIKAGEIKIQNRPFPHKASAKVYHKEKVELFTLRGDLEDEYWRGQKLELETTPTILFEDEGVIAISKPPYMAAHPTGKHLFNCVTVYFEERDNKTRHSIHRLDRETSGVLVLGKNPKAAQICTDFFEKDLVSKCYFFIAHKNQINEYPFIANERLGSEDDFQLKLYVHCYPENSDQGKHAQTRFQKLAENDQYFLGLAFPKTGRQHQIRAHAAHYGLPLVGDKIYNGDHTVFMRFKDEIPTEDDFDKMQISRHALHAVALKIAYPKNEVSIFRAPLPKDLQQWISVNFSDLKLEDLDKKIENEVQNYFQINS